MCPASGPTVVEHFPHRATWGSVLTDCRVRCRNGGRIVDSSAPFTVVPIRHHRHRLAAMLLPARLVIEESIYSTSLTTKILDVVVKRAYLASMTSQHHTTTTTAEPPSSGDASESFGARLARHSREAQGLPPMVADPRVQERLRGLCGLPKPPGGSGVPDELDSAG